MDDPFMVYCTMEKVTVKEYELNGNIWDCMSSLYFLEFRNEICDLQGSIRYIPGTTAEIIQWEPFDQKIDFFISDLDSL